MKVDEVFWVYKTLSRTMSRYKSDFGCQLDNPIIFPQYIIRPTQNDHYRMSNGMETRQNDVRSKTA